MEGIYFQNVPFTATKAGFVSALSKKLEEDCSDVVVKIFTSKDSKRRVAVVSGFKRDVTELIPFLRDMTMCGNHLIAKYDRGDPRNEYGVHVTTRSPSQMRILRQLNMVSSRKTTMILNQEVLSGVDKVLTFQSPNLHVYLNGLDVFQLEKAGKMHVFHRVRRSQEAHGVNFVRVQFDSVMEAVQAISLFNGKISPGGREVLFTDKSGSFVASLNRNSGIGVDGSILDVKNTMTENRYIPVEMLDSALLNNEQLKNLQSKCWKCLSDNRDYKYEIVGVSSDFNFIAGRCHCKYLTDLPVTHKDRAFGNADEPFTRLMANRKLHSEGMDLIVMHEPMKKSYESAKNYRDILAPILFDEWKSTSTEFKELNTTHQASLRAMEVIDSIVDAERTVNVWYAEILVPVSDFWTKDCVFHLRGLTLFLDVTTAGKRTKKEVRKVKVLTASLDNPRTLKLITRLELDDQVVPEVQDNMTAVPKPIKLEFNNTIRVLNKMAKGDIHGAGINTVLYPSTVNIGQPRDITARKNPVWDIGTYRLTMKRLKGSLNEEQMSALETAKSSEISIVLGPPGTGKTYLAAVTMALFGIKENGTILAMTSSNFAADGLAIALKSVIEKFNVRAKVLRVYSKSRESQLIRENLNPLSEYDIPCLHLEVVGHQDWLQADVFQNIRLVFRTNGFYKLPVEEMSRYEAHKADLEQSIFGEYRILVTTVGAASDRRISKWSCGQKITTLVLDEAGQTKQTEMPFLFTFNQRRTVVFGDHLQLKPIVQSLGSGLAGLDTSYMEWIEIGGKRVPWTALREQHRMNPGIRYLVSNLTYDNELRDATSINSRDDLIPALVYERFPDFRLKDIIVYDHNFPENKGLGTSFFNVKEACLACDIAKTLLNSGLDASCLTILTFYDGQRKLIRKTLGHDEVKVANVDAFQGRENVVIILCVTRSNEKGSLGFTKLMNRVNVGISRAKFKMLILCNLRSLTMGTHMGWTKFNSEIPKCSKIIQLK